VIQNLILGFSLLYPIYFILVSGFILAAEALVFFFFWKKWKLALGVSVLVNLSSALMAIPFLVLGFGFASPWISPISSASLFILEGESYFLLEILLFFLPAFGLSVLLEGLIARRVVSSDLKIGFPVVLANLITYSVIYSVLLFLGFWFVFYNTDPTVDALDFFEGNLFYQLTQQGPSSTLFDLMIILFAIAFFLGLCLILFLLIWNIFQRIKSNNST